MPKPGCKILNLRDVPMAIYRTLKVLAAAQGVGIRDYCVSILAAHAHQYRTNEGLSLTERDGDLEYSGSRQTRDPR
jgi:hypothetical protein